LRAASRLGGVLALGAKIPSPQQSDVSIPGPSTFKDKGKGRALDMEEYVSSTLLFFDALLMNSDN
jgi:hypothetical protein